jgi:maltooligosyltrehalose trehalohydrolase
MGVEYFRRIPIGAELQQSGGTHFRVWATSAASVGVRIGINPELTRDVVTAELNPEGNNYFSVFVPEARAGLCYKYQIGSKLYPDPAARLQSGGPHGPSVITDPGTYHWQDSEWSGVLAQPHVIYEMHIGTFTPEGTWAAAKQHIPYLKDLGVDILEIMPIAEFPGRFGWGYDGVCLFAPTALYGSPDDAKSFIDACHQAGLAVILDVVYNHVGPDGNYLDSFSPNYFSERYKNEWGKPFNLDGLDAKPVREFFLSNAEYWIREFHFDGFRFDATQQIFDASPTHLLAEINDVARKTVARRKLYFVAENEPQDVKLVRSREEGGYGLDSVWNDDFHHSAIVALTGRAEAYYSDYRGEAQEFLSAAKWGFLYQGQYYTWQKQNRGTWTGALGLETFVNFIQNHDQIANSLGGHRIHTLASAGAVRAMTCLLLLGPWTPMLFQGEEFAASSPFLYFADQADWLASKIAEGRVAFLQQFPSLSSPEVAEHLPDPGEELTFTRCKLKIEDQVTNSPVYLLHKKLIDLRRSDSVINGIERRSLDGAVYGLHTLVLRYFGRETGNDRLMIFNFDRDLNLVPAAIPLLAPVLGRQWQVVWSSEDPRYAGQGAPPLDFKGEIRLPGYSSTIFSCAQT